MTKSAKFLDNAAQQKLDLLFPEESHAESMPVFDLGHAIRCRITAALKRCPLSRHHVAAKMDELLGKDITKAMLDSWSAESKEAHRFPLEYLPAFVEATGDRSLLRMICELSGGRFVDNDETLKLELGRISAQEQSLKFRKRSIVNMLQQEEKKL
jgi:hypothetical protein